MSVRRNATLLSAKLYLNFVAFALRPLNCFNTAFELNATNRCDEEVDP